MTGAPVPENFLAGLSKMHQGPGEDRKKGTGVSQQLDQSRGD